MFLFARKCGNSPIHTYDFEPYDYGPFSRELYRDLDSLDRDGFIRRNEIPGSNRQVFELTNKGSETVARLFETAPVSEREHLATIKTRVTSLNFTDLLTAVYGEYPEYAGRSKAHI